MSNTSEVIDLTDSFILMDHRGLSNIVIDLDTDDSICNDISCPSDVVATQPQTLLRQTVTKNAKKKKFKREQSWSQRKSVSASPQELNLDSNQFGGCPICWDDLGKNPLASTKCGHVYCMRCIQEYLKMEKKCPTCRHSLKGSSAYHPLYLSRQ